MRKEQEITRQLKKLMENEIQTFPAKVTAIDKDEKTITVIDRHNIEYDDVRLSSIIEDGDKIVTYPKQDSWVLVSIINNVENELFVTAFSEVEEIEGKIEDTEFVINANGYTINRDNENLYTVLDDLIKNVDEQNEQVQAIAQELMSVVVSIGVTPNVPALTQIVNDLIQIVTDRAEINNRLNTILI
jgi:restriction endonuclease S subunit